MDTKDQHMDMDTKDQRKDMDTKGSKSKKIMLNNFYSFVLVIINFDKNSCI